MVENIALTPVGEGLWKTITGGPNDFKIYVADPVGGQIGFMTMIESDGPKAACHAPENRERPDYGNRKHGIVVKHGRWGS
jgi:hypothetical protein